MDDRLANIDLAFRNGLKEYEVLPPPEAWNNIDSRLKGRSKPLYLLRAAAFLAVAVTLSALAYRWIGKSSIANADRLAKIGQESTAPSRKLKTIVPLNKPAPPSTVRNIAVDNSDLTGQAAEGFTDNDSPVTDIEILPDAYNGLPSSFSSLELVHSKRVSEKANISSITIDYPAKTYKDYLSVSSADVAPQEKTERWSIAALASPTYYGSMGSGSDDLSKQIKASEQTIISYSGGVALAYKLNKRLSIQSGLFYSSLGQELDGINSFAGFRQYDNNKGDHNFEILTSSGTVTTTNGDVFLFADGSGDRLITNYNRDVFDPQKASLEYINNSLRQDMSFLELPVLLRYKVIDRAVDLNLIGGLSYNLLVNNSVYTVIAGNKYMVGTTEGLNSFSVSSSFGMGMEYKFSDRLSLNLEPTFRYYLNTFNSSSNTQFHPYSFGIFSGLSYKF